MQAPSHRHNAHPDPAPLHARANRAAIRANDSFEWAHNNLGLLLMNVRLAAAFCLLLLLLLPGCSYLLPAAAPCPPSHRTTNPHLPPPPHPRASLFVPAGRCMLAIASLPAAAASLSVAACRCRCCQVRNDYDGAEREFRRAIELDPSYPWARNNLGLLLFEVKVATLQRRPRRLVTAGEP